MFHQCFVRHHDIHLCICRDLFSTTSEQQSVPRLLHMTTCRAQSADNTGSSIASQAGLQDSCQFGIPIIDVPLSSFAEAKKQSHMWASTKAPSVMCLIKGKIPKSTPRISQSENEAVQQNVRRQFIGNKDISYWVRDEFWPASPTLWYPVIPTNLMHWSFTCILIIQFRSN